MQLSSWVGKGDKGTGGNNPDDVKLVKELLNDVHRKLGLPPLDNSGFVWPILIQSICRFQMRHFGCMTGRINKDGATFARLLKEARSVTLPGPPKMPGDWWVLESNSVREEVVKIANQESAKWDAIWQAAGIGAGKQVDERPGYKLLYQYFQVVEGEQWSEEKLKRFDRSNYNDQLEFPGGDHWCGIFATWVLGQVLKSYGLTVTWKKGKGVMVSNGAWMVPVPRFGTEKTKEQGMESSDWSHGDVCVRRASQHHLILSEKPQGQIVPTIEGNYPKEIIKEIIKSADGSIPKPYRFYRRVLQHSRTNGDWYYHYCSVAPTAL